ncbi:hypothetical protein [Alkalimarinus sediminis]|uniref:Lipoprotein n=1 Tax=Alkalimarinus sediminis TaxID=1632866 RepID=A0A9E8HKA4_9ALTE|nr:hypothetical protein [Alkalimarinus sediminis]UZW74253.1 hypothetical protein NNL22_14670 [Alkalimarinus sediminis]
MTKLQYAYIIPLTLSLTACGGGSSEPSSSGDEINTTDTTTQQVDETNNVSKLLYIEDNNPNIHINSIGITDNLETKSLEGSSSENPLDVYPGDNGFTFEWSITSNVALFSDNFFFLTESSSNASIFALNANPIAETLEASATCTYSNAHLMTCHKPATVATYAATSTTDLTALFSTLPVTLEIKSEVCSLLQGCDLVSIGYLRFN